MIVQFCYSELDSIKYPIIIDSGQVVRKTIVAFTSEQAKQIAIEGIQLDGCLINQIIDSAIIANRNQMINEKNLQIKNQERSLVLKDNIIEGKNQEIFNFQEQIKIANSQVKRQKWITGFSIGGIGLVAIAIPTALFLLVK